MTRKGYKTTSVDIENHLYALSIEEGINLTAFVNLGLAFYHNLPEDPREQLVKDKTKYSVLRLKEKYDREVKNIIKEYSAQNTQDDAIRIKGQELIEFGGYLQRSSVYPIFEKCLKNKNPDDDILRTVTSEVNKMNGDHYDEFELWNKSLDWYKKYSLVIA